MAIEVSVRKEITEYQEKLFFGFSFRQLISIVLMIIVIVPIGALNYFFWKIPIDDLGLGLMCLGAPILGIGWYKKNNMHLEKYVKVRWEYFMLASFYPYKLNGLEEKKVEILTKKERKLEKRRREFSN